MEREREALIPLSSVNDASLEWRKGTASEFGSKITEWIEGSELFRPERMREDSSLCFSWLP